MRNIQRNLLAWTTVIGTIMIMACRSDDIVTHGVKDPEAIYWRLEVNHPAVVLSTLAPYDTVQLAAVPVNVYGTPLPTEALARFRNLVVTDTSIRVTPEGLVTAHMARAQSRVEVLLTVDGVTHGDTVTIMIRNDSPVRKIDSIVLHPGTRDSTHRWAGNVVGWAVQPWTTWLRIYESTGGVALSFQYPIRFSWGDDCIVGALGCSAYGLLVEGQTYVKARTYAYGKVLIDSVLVRNVPPTVQFVTVGSLTPRSAPRTVAFYPQNITIKPGTTVVFQNGDDGYLDVTKEEREVEYGTYGLILRDSIDVVFEGSNVVEPGDSYGLIFVLFGGIRNPNVFPSDGQGGNIAAFGQVVCKESSIPVASWDPTCGGRGMSGQPIDRGYRSRKFTTVGTYRYHSVRYPGVHGTIQVKE